MNLALCFPTRSRLRLAKLALLSAFGRAVPPLPRLYVRLDEDDPDLEDYKAFLASFDAQVKVGPRLRNGNVDYLNDAVQMALDDGADILMQLDDDQIFVTDGWNRAYIEAAKSLPLGIGMLCCKPRSDDHKFIRPPTLTREWVKRTGMFYPPQYQHFFADTEVNDIADYAGVRVMVPGVYIAHFKQKDAMAESRGSEVWRRDALVYAARYDRRKDLSEKLRRIVQSEAVAMNHDVGAGKLAVPSSPDLALEGVGVGGIEHKPVVEVAAAEGATAPFDAANLVISLEEHGDHIEAGRDNTNGVLVEPVALMQEQHGFHGAERT